MYNLYENGKLKAIFVRELDALQYKDILKNISKAAGYKNSYSIQKEKTEYKKEKSA